MLVKLPHRQAVKGDYVLFLGSIILNAVLGGVVFAGDWIFGWDLQRFGEVWFCQQVGAGDHRFAEDHIPLEVTVDEGLVEGATVQLMGGAVNRMEPHSWDNARGMM